MRFRFIFGFILLILALIGIFVGLPYLLQIIKSNQFFNFSFPQLETPRLETPFPGSTSTTRQPLSRPKIGMSIYRYGKGQITLKASFGKGPVNVTGWKIKSLQKGETVIGKGYALPQVDVALSDVLLGSGESADITLGLSPLAGNFRVNNCFGWLGSVYSIDYSLSYCPRIELSDLSGLDSQCQELILQTSSCRAPADDILNKQSSQCRVWVEKNLNYNACVNSRRQDPDFFKGWKIYTGNNNPIIDPLHDKIELRDRANSLIDSDEY